MSNTMTDDEQNMLALKLTVAWDRYRTRFGEPPDGTLKQMLALVDLLPARAEQQSGHRLKCWPDFFASLVNGHKNFEIRKNDRNFKIGDKLTIEEFEPCKQCGGSGRVWDNGDRTSCPCMVSEHPKGRYTGRAVGRVVHYITDFSQRDGYVVMGLK